MLLTYLILLKFLFVFLDFFNKIGIVKLQYEYITIQFASGISSKRN